jgi:ATP-binding cassette, subfamily F, member 3
LHLEAELAQLEAKFADPAYYADEKRLARLIDQQERALAAYNELGGPGLEGQVRALLADIGFAAHEVSLPVKHLSGGQKKLLGLARIILSRPDILLLDEPDNHLDLDGKAMLGKLIETFPGSVVIVSHDRYFLDMVVDEIIEVEHGRISQFKGNYSEYVFDKQLRLQRQAVLFQAQQKEITRLEQAAKRLLMWGKVYDNAKFSNRGKNILKRIDRLEKVDKPPSDQDKLEINLTGWRGSEKVLEICDLTKGFPSADGKPATGAARDIDLLLRYGDRVGMIGPNGAGKSLLIRLILGEIAPDAARSTSVRASNRAIMPRNLRPGPEMSLLETICKAGNFAENRGVAFLKKYRFDL